MGVGSVVVRTLKSGSVMATGSRWLLLATREPSGAGGATKSAAMAASFSRLAASCEQKAWTKRPQCTAAQREQGEPARAADAAP